MPIDRELLREALRFVPDAVRMLRGVLRDDRVPARAKVEAGVALAYVLSPIDLVPDFVVGLGQLDDVAVLGWALKRLVNAAGADVVREHWHGSDEALAMLLKVADVGLRPRRLLRLLLSR